VRIGERVVKDETDGRDHDQDQDDLIEFLV
jgi:hypothetical protein